MTYDLSKIFTTRITNISASSSEIVDEQLGKYHIPCLFDIGLGHKPPRMTFINVAYGIVDWDGKEGKFQQTLKKIAESIFFLLI